MKFEIVIFIMYYNVMLLLKIAAMQQVHGCWIILIYF